MFSGTSAFFSIFLHPSKLYHVLLYLCTLLASPYKDSHCVTSFVGYPYALLIWFCIPGANP